MPPGEPSVTAAPSRLPERRARQRIPLSWPVTVYAEGDPKPVMADLRDMSGGGAYCLSSRQFRCGDGIALEVLLPRELDSENRGLRLVCRGRVVRSDELRPGEFGFACVFHEHALVTPDATAQAPPDPGPAGGIRPGSAPNEPGGAATVHPHEK